MRNIDGQTLEILKSQKMVGQNKFKYEIELKNNGLIKNYLASGENDSTFGTDFVIREDGKCLACFVKYNSLGGYDLHLSIVEKETDLILNHNILQDNILPFTYTLQIDNNGSKDVFRLFKMSNGKILLIINDAGDFAEELPFTVTIYISNNGLGTDFEFLSTAFSRVRVNDNAYYNTLGVSKPVELDNGRIIFFAMTSETYLTPTAGTAPADLSKFTVFMSDDDGKTWTYHHDFISGNVLYDSQGIEYTGSTIYIKNEQNNLIFQQVISSGDAYIIYSEDDGDSWAVSQKYYPSTRWEHRSTLMFATSPDHYLYMLEFSPLDSLFCLYRITTKQKIIEVLESTDTYKNWEKCIEDTTNNFRATYVLYPYTLLLITDSGTIHLLANDESPYDLQLSQNYASVFRAKSIQISKGSSGSNTMTIDCDNTSGRLNPRDPKSELYSVLKTNSIITIKQGYGTHLIESFTGMVDSFKMGSFPQDISIVARDKLKMALDQTITMIDGQHTVHYVDWKIENIFRDMCFYAGLEVGMAEETGMTIDVEFTWKSYADVFQFISDLASFTFGVDESGKAYFRRDYQPDEWELNYTFEAGVDIQQIGLTMSDSDLYSKVIVYGKNTAGETISYEAPFLGASDYNVLAQKIMKIDVSESSVVAELRQVAERAIYLMRTRAIEVSFRAVAVPWLQVGDFIQVLEQTTLSAGVYRITSMTLDMGVDSFLMDLKCFYYADSISPYDLPTAIADQTVDPNMNVIPEMTSDTTPSGVCRSSSVYVIYE